jgi:small subunit ribosomal protein S11
MENLKSPKRVDEERGSSSKGNSKTSTEIKPVVETEKEKPKAAPAPKETKTKKKEEKTGIAYINSSSNNTIVHITDLAGNTISRISGGMITKHSRLKANPTIAMFVAKRAAERPLDLGFNKLYVRMKGKTRFGHGPGSHAAVKSLGKAGFDLISILDTTKVPRGGPKKKGGRRGRRV